MSENPKPGDTPPPGTKCAEKVGLRSSCTNNAKTYAIVRDYGGAAMDPTIKATFAREQIVAEKDAPAVPLCGLHANMYEKRRVDAERRETDRIQRTEERKAHTKRLTVATNLSSMLSDDLPGVSFSPSDDGRSVVLSTEDAAELRDRLAALPRDAAFTLRTSHRD